MVRVLWNEMVNEYRLARDTIKGKSFVMVEGKTDRALWTEFMPAQHSYVVYADGKTDIVDALNSPAMRGINGIAGIVDADYWLITEADELGTENLLYDDCRPDAESILLNSPALNKVLRNNLYNFDVDQVHAFAEKLTRDAQRLAIEFGYVRLVNHVKDYGLRCNAIEFEYFVNEKDLTLDCEGIAERLTADKAWLSSDDLLKEVEAKRKLHSPDDPQLCRGKDMVAILAYLLPTRFKTEFGEDLPGDTRAALHERALSIRLRSAYDSEYFQQTSLFNCIRQWESQNTPYRIIRDFAAQSA